MAKAGKTAHRDVQYLAVKPEPLTPSRSPPAGSLPACGISALSHNRNNFLLALCPSSVNDFSPFCGRLSLPSKVKEDIWR
jgi:hypothetical protein